MLQRLNGSGTWRGVQRIRGTQRPTSGSGTVTASGTQVGVQSFRVAFRGSRGGWVASGRATVQVYGPVPIRELVRVSPGSVAQPSGGQVVIGGQAVPVTFRGYAPGTSTWRRVVEIQRTSCKAVGIPLVGRPRTGTTGLFTMRVVTDGDALVAANAAQANVGAGLLTPVPVGQRLAVQVGADEDMDFFGSGQAICYTANGKA